MTRSLSPSLAAALTALATALLASTPALAKPLDVTFTLAVHVAEENGAPVQDDAWLDAEVAQAERLFAPIGVHFAREEAAALPARFAHLETRADRDALVKELDRGRISVFVTGSLRDVDAPPLLRQGVHWRPEKQLAKHYVILAATAGATTLAHELGHFFGNGHSTTLNNVMSYLRFGDDVFFDEPQKRKIATFAGIYLRSKELTLTPR